MRAVNLLPKDDARSRRTLPSPWVLLSAVAPILAGSLVYLGYSVEHSSVVAKRGELGVVQARLATLTAARSGVAAESGLLSQKVQRQIALQDALGKAMPWDVTLDDLARVIPTDVWLTNLTVDSPTPAGVAAPPPTPTPTTPATTTTTTSGSATPATPAPAPPVNPTAFTLTGYAHSQDAVAHLLARLRLMPMLGNVALGNTSAATGDTSNGIVQFTITASIQALPKAAGL